MATKFTDTNTSRSGLSPATFPPSEIANIRRAWNSRHKVSQARIEELAHQIASCPVGQIEPVKIRKGEGGYAYLIAGNTRTDAIQYINDHLPEFQALYPHLTGPLSLHERTLIFPSVLIYHRRGCAPKQPTQANSTPCCRGDRCRTSLCPFSHEMLDCPFEWSFT